MDINECAISTDNCAAEDDGGQCTNTVGGFACSCVAGYFGDGETCYSDKTVSFLPPANGALSAAGGGAAIDTGETTAHGTTITFIAAPDGGYRLSAWLGDCAGEFDLSCKVMADGACQRGRGFSPTLTNARQARIARRTADAATTPAGCLTACASPATPATG